MTFGSQGEGHGGNDIEWVGTKHLYLNFDDPRLLVLYSWLPSIFDHIYLYDFEISGARSRWE